MTPFQKQPDIPHGAGISVFDFSPTRLELPHGSQDAFEKIDRLEPRDDDRNEELDESPVPDPDKGGDPSAGDDPGAD